VVGLVCGTGLIIYNIFFVNRGPRLADSMTVVDVTTGEFFQVDLAGKGYVMPGKNPTTRKRALIAIVKDESGNWSVPGRFMGSFNEVDGEVTAVDRATGQLKGEVGEIKALAHPTTWDETFKR